MRGQMTIQGVMFAALTIIFIAVISPVLYTFIAILNNASAAAGDTTTPVITNAIPSVLMIGVLVGIVIYAIAGRARGQEE